MMASLKATYQTFLASPSAAALASNASLSYITTLTTVNTSAAIAKHLSTQQRIVRKKEEKILTTIESSDALCLDVETTIEFVGGGGAYLPGLDDNFLYDRVVTFPLVGSHLSVWLLASTKQMIVDTHRAFWRKSEDPADPSLLGPRLSSQACRRDWSSCEGLAYPRR